MSRLTRLTALLLAWAALAGLTACGAEAPPPTETQPIPVITTPTPQPEDPEFALVYAASDSLHPLEATDRCNLDISPLVYEGLYEVDETFTAHPVLADSAEVSEDGLTWYITPRSDIVFTDGTPLDCSHVVSSLKAAMKKGAYTARLAGISSVKEKKGRVVITLKTPNGALPALLDVPIFLTREEGLPLGTGPYVIGGTQEEPVLEANPNWWQEREPTYERIPLRGTGRLDERVSAFDSGLATAVTTDPTAAGALGYSSVYDTYDFATTDMLFVGFNTAAGFCTDPVVRGAVSRALDRASVVSSFLSGWGDEASLPVLPLSDGYCESVAETLDYDLAQAAAMLEAGGYTRGKSGTLMMKRKEVTLRFIVNQDNLIKQEIARFLAEELRQLGFAVTVDELGWDDYMAALTAGEFDLYLGETVLTADFDISSLTFGALNYGLYWDETVYTLLEVWKASSGDARKAAGDALYEALAGNLPFAPLCFKRNCLYIRWGIAQGMAPVRGNPYNGVENWKIN